MTARTLESIQTGQATQDGDRIPLVRLVPGLGQLSGDAFRAMDPFLLLDHFGPIMLPAASDAGFPAHPHRGFQTLTYLIQGAFRHRDSTGGAGLLGPGGAQLMNAGAGIVHEELPVPEQLALGGPIEGVQLWINLPRAEKASAPGCTDLQPADLPWQAVPGGRMKALAGQWLGRTGPARTPARIAYAHLELEPGAGFAHPLPAGWTAAVAVLHGAVLVAGRPLATHQIGLLSTAGDGVALGSPAGASLLLLAGQPLGEPIAHYGPFVLNTREELEQAFQDYAIGRMGRL